MNLEDKLLCLKEPDIEICLSHINPLHILFFYIRFNTVLPSMMPGCIIHAKWHQL
jgi:hypothetical protein